MERNIEVHPGNNLHVELPGAIVNIRTDLRDEQGRQVSRVDVNADGFRYAGELQWWCPDLAAKGINPEGIGIRVVQMDRPNVPDRGEIAKQLMNLRQDLETIEDRSSEDSVDEVQGQVFVSGRFDRKLLDALTTAANLLK